MTTDKTLLSSMLESAKKLKSFQQQNLGPGGSPRSHKEGLLDVDALLAQQMSEALESVSPMDVVFLVRFIEEVVDFRETFAVVQRALEKARKGAVRGRRDLLRNQIEAFHVGTEPEEARGHTAY